MSVHRQTQIIDIFITQSSVHDPYKMIFSVFKYKHTDVYDGILFPQFVTHDRPNYVRQCRKETNILRCNITPRINSGVFQKEKRVLY